MEEQPSAPFISLDGEERPKESTENTRDTRNRPEQIGEHLVKPHTQHELPQQNKQSEQVEEHVVEQAAVVAASDDPVLDQDPGPEAMPQPETDEAAHPTTADRVPFYPWGPASEPSIPSVDSNEPSVPETFDDTDSALGSARSSTMSANSSIYEFPEWNGRTYHKYKEGKYHLPNDEEEQDRLDLQHAIFLMTTGGKLVLAPIDPNVLHVLDIGTGGTGIWAIEFAQRYPGADVLGTDLSPIQPEYVPPNCRFEIDDADDNWTYGAKFDLIHARALLSCFSDHKKVIQSCFDALAPGGWCEWQDLIFPLRHVGPIPENTILVRWSEMIAEAGAKLGRPWTNVAKYRQYFEEIGFENIEERIFYWPVGPWPRGDYYKSIAMYFTEDIQKGMEPVSLKLFPALGYSPEEIQVMLAKVRRDMRDPAIHSYLPVTFIYGQKPQPQTQAL